MNPAVSYLWPTVVAGLDIAAPAGVNAALVDAVRKVAEHTKVPGSDLHYTSTVIDHIPLLRRFGDNEAVNWWLAQVSDMAMAVVRKGYGTELDCDLQFSGHGIIAKAGDRLPAHRHQPCHFVVTYYPYVDRPTVQDRLNDGALSLIDDRSWNHLFRNRNPAFQDGSAFRIHPRAGLMVCFPGYVMHETNTYPGPGERVTLTATVTIRMEREYG